MEIENRFGPFPEPFALSLEELEQIALGALQEVSSLIQDEPDCSFQLLLTGNEEIKAINEAHRGIAMATDVLSFPMNEFHHSESGKLEVDQQILAPNPHGILELGDLVLSIPFAMDQAAVVGHSVRDEFLRLFVHGLLHLIGFDHEKSAQMERRMQAEEDRIIEKIDPSH